MAMERIERALELARQQRNRTADISLAVANSGPAPDFAGEARVVAELSTAATGDAPTLNPELAQQVELPNEPRLRELRVVLPRQNDPAAQSYKMLRAQVLQRARQHGMRAIGIVSAVQGEGRTLTAINLALSLAAEPNQSVILVDFDLHQPAIARALDLPAAPGVETHFTDGAPIETLWRRFTGLPRFTLLPAGAPLPASSEWLAGDAARSLMTTLRGAAGNPLILVDLPPALLFDDVLAAAPLLDGVIVVVAEGRTRREDLARVFELLRSTPVVGTVLNESDDAESRER
jgi:protein-tyrosine kinase